MNVLSIPSHQILIFQIDLLKSNNLKIMQTVECSYTSGRNIFSFLHRTTNEPDYSSSDGRGLARVTFIYLSFFHETAASKIFFQCHHNPTWNAYAYIHIYIYYVLARGVRHKTWNKGTRFRTAVGATCRDMERAVDIGGFSRNFTPRCVFYGARFS